MLPTRIYLNVSIGMRLFGYIFLSMVPLAAAAQTQTPPKKKKHFIKEVYASWGYNGEFYTHSTIHISQSALGNNYNFVSVKAHDHDGWNDGLFHEALSIPQYNYRLGFGSRVVPRFTRPSV